MTSEEAVGDVLSATAGLVGLSFARDSDEASLALGNTLGVRPFHDRPRVIIVSGAARGGALGFQLDVRDSAIQALPYEGLPRVMASAFQALSGRIDADLAARDLSELTGLTTLAPADIVEAAREAGVALETVSPTRATDLGRLSELPEAAVSRLEQDARGEGGIVLVPTRAVDVSGVERVAWWQILSPSGRLGAVLEDGTRGAVSGFLATSTPEGTGDQTGALLDLSVSLYRGVLGRLDARFDPSSDACRWLCDAATLSSGLCGEPVPLTLEGCMAGRSQGSDPLGLALSCDELVTPFRCGVALGAGVVGGSFPLTVEGDAYWGPWPNAGEAVRATSCDCD